MPNTSDQPNQVPPLHDEIGQQLTGGTGRLGPIPYSGDDEVPAELHWVDAVLRQDSVAWATYLPPTTRVTSYAGSFPATGVRSLASSSADIPASAPYQAVVAADRRESRFKQLTFRVSVYAAVLVVVIGAFAVFRLGAGSRSTPISTGPESLSNLRYPLVTGSNDIQTLDPALVADPESATPARLIFPGMFALDANGVISRWAATAMPTFDMPSFPTNSYTIHIRPGLTWSDGTPIDANTFAYSINRTLTPCTGSPVAFYLFPIKDAQAYANESCATDGMTIQGNIQTLIGDSISVPDTQTLIIQLSAPAPYFLDILTTSVGLAQPYQLINQYGSKNWTAHLADHGGFGGNLYKVQLWDHHANLVLTRNPAFWGAQPSLREVAFHIYPTTEAEYTDYLDGRLDLGFPPTELYQSSRQRPDFFQMPLLAIRYYQPSWFAEPFNDVRVRQAFELALNKEVLASQALGGSVIPTNHIVPAGMAGYDPNLAGPDGTQNLSGNAVLATSLMQSYADANCGGLLSRCPLVTLVDSYNDVEAVAVDRAAVAMWRQAFPGYPIQTRFMSDSAYMSLIQAGPAPQIFGVERLGDYSDPQEWLSRQFGSGAINNIGVVDVPAANTLMSQADQDLGPDRMSVYNQAEQLLVTTVAEIPVCQQLLYYTLPSYVHGLQFSSLGQVPLTSWQQIYLADH